MWHPGEGTDFDAVQNGYVSITPLHLDLTHNGRVAVYMGDDDKFEYIYKFVSDGLCRPGDAAEQGIDRDLSAPARSR